MKVGIEIGQGRGHSMQKVNKTVYSLNLSFAKILMSCFTGSNKNHPLIIKELWGQAPKLVLASR